MKALRANLRNVALVGNCQQQTADNDERARVTDEVMRLHRRENP